MPQLLGAEITKAAVQAHLRASTQQEIFDQMAKPLFEQGFVKEEFASCVAERERNYPTALQLETRGVAIPHTDPEHVNGSAVSVATLEAPVAFSHMGDIETKVEVTVLFMLALKGAHEHLEMLQRIIGVIQDTEKLERIAAAAGDEELYEVVLEYFS